MRRSFIAGLGFMLAAAMPAQARHLNTLHTFTGPDGDSPTSSLIADAQGNLYGTTYQGGSAGNGTVFRIAPDGTVTTLYDFHSTHGAIHPNGPLLRDAQGNLIGAAPRADGKDGSVIYSISAAGQQTVLHRFSASGGVGYGLNGAMVLDADGNMFGATTNGGPYNCGVAFRLSPDGSIKKLHIFGADGDGCTPSSGLTAGPDGNLYGGTLQGGRGQYHAGDGILFKLSPGGAETILHTFDRSQNDGARPSGPLLFDAQGNIFGTTIEGAWLTAAGGTVYKLAADGTMTILHGFPDIGNHDDGSDPLSGVIADAKGNLYGTTQQGGLVNLGTVFKVAPNGKETVLHWFNAADGAMPEGSLLMDAQENMFSTTALCGAGSPCGKGTVFELEK